MEDKLANPKTFFARANSLGAFVPHGHVVRSPSHEGPLSGVTVAVKDLVDWAGVPTGAGNPAWLDSHAIPERDAFVLARLLGAGATLVGKTVTDELAYSIQGDNVHYGTPHNPSAEGRVPGGSSSGSAAAVAGGLVDTALGTDTGGSVRVPAAYCGLFGLRTTHGRIDRSGVVELAPSFDCLGWFGRTLAPVSALAGVLLPELETEISWTKVWTLPEVDPLTDGETRRTLSAAVRSLGLPTAGISDLTTPYGGLEGLRKSYATLQGWEAWQAHGDWIGERKPVFGPAIAHRFLTASLVTDEEAEEARQTMLRFRNDLRSLLGSKGVLLLPAASGPAPLIDEAEAKIDEVRTRTLRLTCLAGLGGLPQLTVPFRGSDGLPRGLGLLGPADSDRALLALAARTSEVA